MKTKSSIQVAKRLGLDELSALPVTHEAVIDEEYLDSNGHMNVSWYLHLFNRATGGTYRWLGFDWRRLREQGTSTFALETHVRYFAELLVGEQITVRTRLMFRTPKRIHLIHFMFNEDTQLLSATHEEVMAHMDLTARCMTPYPDPLAKQLDDALVKHQALPWEAPLCGAMGA
jgi:acyl-CoA thioester hydrolase